MKGQREYQAFLKPLEDNVLFYHSVILEFRKSSYESKMPYVKIAICLNGLWAKAANLEI